MAAHTSQALLVDDFTDVFTSPLETEPGDPPATSFESGAAGVLFDDRSTTLIDPVPAPGASSFTTSTLEIDPAAGGELGFINDPNVEGSAFSIEYVSAVGEDLTDGGLNSAFAVEISFSDIAPPEAATITFDVTDGGGDSDSASVIFDVAGSYLVSFAAFDPSVDFDDVEALVFSIDAPGVASPDVAISSISTVVPEPAAYAAIFGALALGLGLLRRRWTRG